MPAIRCFVGQFRSGLQLPFQLQLDGSSIPDYFANGSLDSSGQPAIRMQMDFSRLTASIAGPGQVADARSLNMSLRRLTQNMPHVSPVNNIGLIIADRFAFRDDLLGLMFDFGFNPGGMDSVGVGFTEVPREGCVIFLDAIARLRPNAIDFQREVVCTAIHELGHVFNLWHIEESRSFMASSERSNVLPASACKFHSLHRDFLSRGDTDLHVKPGGSPFDDRGPFDRAANDPFNGKKDKDLQLKINVSQNEFWFFEPVELDLRLSSKKGEYELPDEIDPGYDRFIIHITRPDGTRFKYRSPRIYCSNPARLKVSPRKPFLRDISIFGQSGGYTFDMPGEYKIQCVFDMGRGRKILSNELAVCLKHPMIRNERYQRLQKILTKKDPALFLYHRSGKFRPETIALLKDVVRKEKRSALAMNLVYAMAKFNNRKRKQLAAAEIQPMKRMINVALDSGKLGSARIRNLKEMKDKWNL